MWAWYHATVGVKKSVGGWLREHWPVLIPAGIVAAGAAWLLAPRSKAVVAYPTTGSDTGTFRADAQGLAAALRAAGWPTVLAPVATQPALAAVLAASRPVAKLVLVGHGTSAMFLRGSLDLTPDALASMLAPTIASRATVGLAGCRAGADTGEPDWGPYAYGPGGATSFAGQLRDALVRLRVTGAVRAHSSTGGTAANPSGRIFLIEPEHVGRPGLSGIDVDAWRTGAWQDSATRADWIARFRAGLGNRWMSGI